MLRAISNFIRKIQKLVWTERSWQLAVNLFLTTCLLGTVILAVCVSLFPTMQFEIWITKELQEDRIGLIDNAMIFISSFGELKIGLIQMAVFSLLFLLTGNTKEAKFLWLTVPADCVNYGLKLLIYRPRPTEDAVDILQTVYHTSFPSGHVVHYTVFYGFLALVIFRTSKIPLFLKIAVFLYALSLIGLVSVSRVYLGAHWVTDVIGGYLVGSLLLYGIMTWYKHDVTPHLLKMKNN